MTPNTQEQDHQMVDVGVDQQTLMDAAQEALIKQKGQANVSKDDLMDLMKKLTAGKPLDNVDSAQSMVKLPSGETQAQRDAAKQMILASLANLGGVDGPLPAALGGGNLP